MCLNPFGTGNSFIFNKKVNIMTTIAVLIPSEQGIVLYGRYLAKDPLMIRLNPFGTGNSFI